MNNFDWYSVLTSCTSLHNLVHYLNFGRIFNYLSRYFSASETRIPYPLSLVASVPHPEKFCKHSSIDTEDCKLEHFIEKYQLSHQN